MSGSVAFDRAVEYYDATRRFAPGVEAPLMALMARAGGVKPDSQVIEIGIGTGRVALPFSRHAGRICGVDLSRPMLGKLREKRAGEAVFVAEGDATRLPYPDAAFNAAVAVHVFHLIPNWQDALAELARVLKPGGVLIHTSSGQSGHNLAFPDLNAVLREHLPPKARVGVPDEAHDTFALEQGWTQAGPVERLAYNFEATPAGFLEMLKGRRWSSLWSVSDSQLVSLVDRVEAIMAERYPDRNRVYTFESHISVQCFRPPARPAA